MIIKKIGRSRLYDNVHKTVVSVCLVMTGIGLALFGSSVFDFYKKGKFIEAEAQAVENKENSSEESKLE